MFPKIIAEIRCPECKEWVPLEIVPSLMPPENLTLWQTQCKHKIKLSAAGAEGSFIEVVTPKK